jgi:hypothetical protein
MSETDLTSVLDELDRRGLLLRLKAVRVGNVSFSLANPTDSAPDTLPARSQALSDRELADLEALQEEQTLFASSG